MLKELFLVLLACLVLAALTEAAWCNWSKVNGCSVPANIPFFYKRRFTGACNKHDFCYYCGQRRGVSKRVCDVYFYINMWRRCKWYMPYCKTFARAYYRVVWAFGYRYYSRNSPAWCNQNWVIGCMA